MNATDERVIQFNKAMVVQIILGSFAIASLGLWLFMLDDASIGEGTPYGASRRPVFSSPLFVHLIGLFIAFCGVLNAAFFMRRLSDKRPGLIFSNAGVLIGRQQFGLIPWSEIIGVEIVKLNLYRSIVVRVKNPAKYAVLGDAKSQSTQWEVFEKCGSPIAIQSTEFNLSPDELRALFDQYLLKYRNHFL